MWWPWKKEIEELRSRVEELNERLNTVRLAHDALFDAVAEDLGYMPTQNWNCHGREVKATPREPLVKWHPPEIVRRERNPQVDTQDVRGKP